MKNNLPPRHSGFTLIELIATVAVVAVFSAMMLTMFSDTLIRSSDSLKNGSRSSDLCKAMANILSDYTPYPRWKPSTSYAVGNKVLPTGMNGRFYICINAGISAASEPEWRDYEKTQDGSATWRAGVWVPKTSYAAGDLVVPTDPNGHLYRCTTAGTTNESEPKWKLTSARPITDGSAQWMRLLGYLQLQIGAADGNRKETLYGKYCVVENRFVTFVSHAMQSISEGDAENMLAVKIKNEEGEILTALFTAKEH